MNFHKLFGDPDLKVFGVEISCLVFKHIQDGPKITSHLKANKTKPNKAKKIGYESNERRKIEVSLGI